MAKQILLTPRGSISDEDKVALQQENVLIVEVDDATKIKTISELNVLGADEVVSTIIEAANSYTTNSNLRSIIGEAILKKTTLKIKNKQQ